MESGKKTGIIAVIIIVLVLLAGTGFFIFTENEDANNSSESTEHETKNSTENESAETEDSAPEYVQGANIGETIDATGQEEVKIEINDFIFEQTVVTVSKGTKITWTNEGNARHDVKSDENSPQQGLSSELMANGESYSFTFDEVGTYNYFCTPHSSQMKAVIEVVE